ncbi:ead/Ea22-like family protein [Escherichia coli]|uniref:ead/Ea22-like family protein n=1 Tax=Escherichia coli TaxID=562 RepID=UPI002DBBDFCA|nr:ead/Ea22-like family protein [Escherichia coli]
MSNIDKRALRHSAESIIGILENIAGFEPSDIDGDSVETRFETEDGFDTGCDVSIVDQCQKTADVVRALLDELEAAEKRIAELESGSQAQKLVEAIIVAIENEQERLFDEDYLMDSKECIDVIREEVKRWNDSRAAGIRIKGE